MKRILSESINIGNTVNLYSEVNESPRSFIGQAKITNKLQDKTEPAQSIGILAKKPTKKNRKFSRKHRKYSRRR